jgi:hypothetical protein
MPLQQPTAEEIEAQLSGRALTAVVFFLDETFEEIAWDMSTTVVDANMQLAGLIKLTNHETFTLFESRKVSDSAALRGVHDIWWQCHMSPPSCDAVMVWDLDGTGARQGRGRAAGRPRGGDGPAGRPQVLHCMTIRNEAGVHASNAHETLPLTAL